MDPVTIAAIISGGIKLFQIVADERARLKQRGEWTAEQEAAFSAEMEKAFKGDAWAVSGG